MEQNLNWNLKFDRTHIHFDLTAPEIVWSVSIEEERWRSGGMRRNIFGPRGPGGGRGSCQATLCPKVPVIFRRYFETCY